MTKLKETLDLIMKYPRIKSITVDQEGRIPGALTIELYPEPQKMVEQSIPFPVQDSIPSDDQMLFYSTPTFDELSKNPDEP